MRAWTWPLWAIGLPVAAQTLPQVTVSATRTEAAPFDVPASVDVLDAERLRGAGRPEVQLSEALAFVPGIAARDRQNFAQDLQLSIRGFGARSTFGVRGVRLYVDGIPATLPDGQGQLSHFDLSSASRVEVLRGPFSALYGNSSGGVVQMFTEAGEGPPAVTGSVVAGSDGLLKPALRAAGSSGPFGYSLSASRFTTDGWREHSAAERAVGNARLDWRHAGGDWTLVANALDLRADDPLGLTRAQFQANPRGVDAGALQFDTRKTVRQSQLGLVHEHRFGTAASVRVMVYGGTRATTQFQAIPVAAQGSPLHPGGVIDLERDYAGADLRFTLRRRLEGASSFEAVAGLAYDRLGEDRRGWQNFIGPVIGVQGALRRDESNRAANLDPYAQGVWKAGARWTFTAGVRHSSVRFDSRDHYIAGSNGDDSGAVRYGATLPAFGALLAITPALHAYAAAGRGFETPTLNELSYRPDGRPGLNFGLRPSRSRSYEAGLKGRHEPGAGWRTQWTLAAFETATRDEIVTQTNSGGRSTFQNAGATRRQGAELGWSAEHGSGWRVQLAQTWLDARYRDPFATCVGTPCTVPGVVIPAGNRIPGTAASSTGLELAWQPLQGWRGGLEARHSGAVAVNDANSDAAPAYTTFALHGGYRWETRDWKLDATVRADNVTNRRYAGSVIVNEGNGRFFEPAPGRQFSAKLTVTRAL